MRLLRDRTLTTYNRNNATAFGQEGERESVSALPSAANLIADVLDWSFRARTIVCRLDLGSNSKKASGISGISLLLLGKKGIRTVSHSRRRLVQTSSFCSRLRTRNSWFKRGRVTYGQCVDRKIGGRTTAVISSSLTERYTAGLSESDQTRDQPPNGEKNPISLGRPSLAN